MIPSTGLSTVPIGVRTRLTGAQTARRVGATWDPCRRRGGWVRLEVPASSVGLQGKTVTGMAYTLYGGRASWDRAGVRHAAYRVTKRYRFNGQVVAERKHGVLTYLHTDHLGSPVLTTNSSGTTVTDHGYYAYGLDRRGGELGTDHRFTGQKLDGVGLQYFNARYYDPELGAFISPDTIVPDGGVVSDYNRYAYSRGNPLKFSDPSGHCVNSTTTNKPDEITYDNDDCWRFANTIGAMWDSTDYWSNRFASKDVFFTEVANNGYNGTDFFQGQLTNFLSSDDGNHWLHEQPRSMPSQPINWADYVAITWGFGFAPGAGISEVSIIVDQYWNVYGRYGMGANTRGISVSTGGVLINTDPSGNLLGERTGVDELNVSEAERVQLLKGGLSGYSASASGTVGIGGVGGSVGLESPYNTTIEAVIAGPGVSVAPWSYTFLLWEAR